MSEILKVTFEGSEPQFTRLVAVLSALQDHPALNRLTEILSKPDTTVVDLDDLILWDLDYSEDCGNRKPYEDARFSEADKQLILGGYMDEAADMDKSDIADMLMEQAPLVDLVAAATPVHFDIEELARMLDVMMSEDDGHINGEFLREHGEDGEGHADMLDFAKRMRLISPDENSVTDLGREFKDCYL